MIPCHSNPARRSRPLRFPQQLQGRDQPLLYLGSVPNGNDGSSPASRAGFRASVPAPENFAMGARNFKTLRQLSYPWQSAFVLKRESVTATSPRWSRRPICP